MKAPTASVVSDHRATVCFTDRQWSVLRARAAHLQISVSEVVRRMLDEIIDGDSEAKKKLPATLGRARRQHAGVGA